MDPRIRKTGMALVLTLLLLAASLGVSAEELPAAPSGTPVPEAPEPPISQGQKLPGTASISQSSIIFGQGTAAPQVHSETNLSEPQITYKIQGAEDSSYTDQVPTAVGVYTVRVVYPETETHLKAQDTVDFTIRAYISDISLAPFASVPGRVYNGVTDPVPLPSVLPFHFTVEGTSQLPQPGRDYEVSASLLSPHVDTDPESRNISLTLSFHEGLYALAPDISTAFTVHGDIYKAPLTVTALDQATKEGFSSDLSMAKVTGLAEGDVLASLTITADSLGTALVPSQPVILRDGADVTDQYEIRLISGRLTHSAGISEFPSAAEKLSYNGRPQPLLKTPGAALSQGTMVYAVRYHASQASEETLISPWSRDLPMGTVPGIYIVDFKAAQENLQDSEVKSLVVIIAPKVLEISALGQKTYDGTKNLPEENITLSFDESQILPGEDVTVRTIEGSSYETILAGENLKITPGNAVLEGADAGNYSVKVLNFTGRILKKPVTVTALPAEKAYGQQDPALPYKAQGLVGKEQLSGRLSRAPGEAMGTYAVTQGTLDNSHNPNYDISFQPASLKIRSAAPQFHITFSKGKVRPGRTLTVTVTARNGEENLMAGGWAQPKQVKLRQDSQPLELKYQGSGQWSADFTVPKDAPRELSFYVSHEDTNYNIVSDRASVKVSRLGTNPQTGDQIRFYGTMLGISTLALAGAVGLVICRKKKK